MENQNCILGSYKKYIIPSGSYLLQSIEYGYFLRKEGNEEFFPIFLKKEGKEVFPSKETPPSGLVAKINREKMVTLYQEHEQVLNVTQKMIIVYTSLKDIEEEHLVKAMKEASQTSKE